MLSTFGPDLILNTAFEPTFSTKKQTDSASASIPQIHFERRLQRINDDFENESMTTLITTSYNDEDDESKTIMAVMIMMIITKVNSKT